MRTNLDMSTIDAEVLAKLPRYVEGDRRTHLRSDPGNGCAGDPPGYPSYFTRSVYTPNGNDPSQGPTMVITGPDGVHRVIETAEWSGSWEKHQEKREALFRKLWKPLPIDHPRVQGWIVDTLKHHARCYVDDAGKVAPAKYGRPDFFVYPLPYYVLKHFHDDPRFSDEWRAKEKAAVEAFNAEQQAKAAPLATFNNALAVRSIREVYPDFGPDTEVRMVRYHVVASGAVIDSETRKASEWIADPPKVHQGDWWHRHAERPRTAEECDKLAASTHLRQHSTNVWCQFCGLVQ